MSDLIYPVDSTENIERELDKRRKAAGFPTRAERAEESFNHELHTDSQGGGSYTNRGKFKSEKDAREYAEARGYKSGQYSIKEHQKPEWGG
jgi:hypothetical protein